MASVHSGELISTPSSDELITFEDAPDPRSSRAPEPMDDGPIPIYEGLVLYQFTVEQYQRLGECEIIGSDESVFLLDGMIVYKMTKNSPNVIASDSLMPLLVRAMPEGWHLSNQNPVVIKPRNEPEPDFKIVRGRPNDYRHRKAEPPDVAVLIEISDSSLRKDQTIMKARYAKAGIPIYWIVNLVAGRIEVYTEPTGPDVSPDYRHRQDFGPDDSVPLTLDGREVTRIAVRDILPLND
jgi:Uma2 family endonuclease